MNKLSNEAFSKTFTWQSPSNIALVKYWGKHGAQLPSNPSISFTLKNCHTITTLKVSPKVGLQPQFEVMVDGVPQESFVPKVASFLQKLSEMYPQLSAFDYALATGNTFPHSSGIASSASGMSALALCLVDLLIDEGLIVENRLQLASTLARIGSGSACRSIYGGLVMWGQHEAFEGSHDEFAIPVLDVNPVFKNYRDDILIVHEGKKSVSSSAGHELLKGHPFAAQRFERARQNMTRIQKILREGELKSFVELVEEEALMLHAMMMTSSPSYLLMLPNTLAIISAIRKSRADKGHHICFTLDAGANVHMLYPVDEAELAHELIQEQLVVFCENGRYLRDEVGNGPIKPDA